MQTQNRRHRLLNWALEGYIEREAARLEHKRANPVLLAAEASAAVPVAGEVKEDSSAAQPTVIEATRAFDYDYFWELLDRYAYYPATLILGVGLDASNDIKDRADEKMLMGTGLNVGGHIVGSDHVKKTGEDLQEQARKEHKSANDTAIFSIGFAFGYFMLSGLSVCLYWGVTQGLIGSFIRCVKSCASSVMSACRSMCTYLCTSKGAPDADIKTSVDQSADCIDPAIPQAVVVPPPAVAEQSANVLWSHGSDPAAKLIDSVGVERSAPEALPLARDSIRPTVL